MYGVNFNYDIGNFVEVVNQLLGSLNILVLGNFSEHATDVSL
jgi:hypothetical protein